MPELRLTHQGDHLHIQLGARQTQVEWRRFVALAGDAVRLANDPAGYGRELYTLVFADAALRAAVESLSSGARLLLVSDDEQIGAAGWEYLRDGEDRLVAGRLSLVRGLAAGAVRAGAAYQLPAAPARVEIVAVVAAPVNDAQALDTEGEWKQLHGAVVKAGKAVRLTRVRPPTLATMSRTINPNACSIVHFMGHSNSVEGRSVLYFEDEVGHGQAVAAGAFADRLDPGVALVVLNSCRSAVAAEWTEFGNLARGLAGRGVPYALGMRAVLPDAAAVEITGALYAYLLQGRSIEDAVRRLRDDLAANALLASAAWLAGLPLLYTGLPADAPALSLAPLLAAGAPAIDPDPAYLDRVFDLNALPPATHFVGRSDDVAQALAALTGPHRTPLVVIHGLGGVGKTALAHAVASRTRWRFGDRVLGVSFETFVRMDGTKRIVDAQFAPLFFNRLARFYGLDPADADRYPTPAALQEAILQQRTRQASLLVLDNLETLLDALEQAGAVRSQAQPLAAFLARLHEGDGAVLMTTRIEPPASWGKSRLIHLGGLDDKAGAALFWELLPPDRRTAAPLADRMALNHRVQGHPVSLRLLAGRFGESVGPLAGFAATIEAALRTAEQRTPASLADPERQATLYATMAYSVERLAPAQRETLRRVSVFRTPFPAELGVMVAADAENTGDPPADALRDASAALEALTAEGAERQIQELVRLGVLEMAERTTADAGLLFYDLHAMLRWYVAEMLPAPDEETFARYAAALAGVARRAYDDFDRHGWLRLLVNSMVADLDAALPYLPPPARSLMAYHLAQPYQRIGLVRRALELYEEALELAIAEDNPHNVAVTQSSMADVLMQMGKPNEAMALYKESLETKKALGDVREIAVTQSSMADVLMQMGKPNEAMALYKESLETKKALGDVREIAVTQSSMADVLMQMGKPNEAMALYKESLETIQALGDVRAIAVTQSKMADVLMQMGKPNEAMALYKESLETKKALGDVRAIAVTQSKMADVLMQMGKPNEAMALYKESLETIQALGDVRAIAVTQSSMADVLMQMGKPNEAMALYKESLETKKALGDVRAIAVTQSKMADVLMQMGKPNEAMALYKESLETQKALGDVREIAVTQSSMADVLMQMGKPNEAMALYKESLETIQALGDVREIAVTQSSMADVLMQMGKPNEAMALYKESLETIQALGDVRAIAVTQSKMADVLMQMGKPNEAMALYKESLETQKALGDVRAIAVTQSSMADVLMQMGKPNEAMALYKESLETIQALGDVRAIAVTQSKMADVLMQMGKPNEAMALYKESLETKKALGDVRAIAVTQSKMADVLMQMGKPNEAMALYKESLETIQALGDVRAIAVTQSSMADVLMQMGKPNEAMALYKESLETQKALGDVRAIAVTQANFGQFLLQQGEGRPAMEMLWAAYTTLARAGYAADAATMRHLLAAVKTQVLGAARFDAIWAEAVGGAQPGWLAATEAAPPGRYHLPPDQQAALVTNTVAVLTAAPDKLAEWRGVIAGAGQQMADDGMDDLAALNNAILALLDDQPAELPPDNEYHALWQRILDGVAQGGLTDEDEDEETDPQTALRMAAINAFVGANDWAASRRVVAAQQELLLTAAAEQIFVENIARARASGDNRASAYFQQHLDLLLACRRVGIDAAFDALEAAATDSDGEDSLQLPFDAALIEQTIAALRGSPHDRIAHLQALLPLAAHADDPALKAFWNAVQMALVGGDLREAGRNLTGVYAQVWQAIVATVTGEAPVDLLDVLVQNTLAVLGPARAQRGQWEDELAQLHSRAAAEGARGLADLVETILALLAADGKTAGLGAGLEEPFAAAWRRIVEGL
jgi:tetratricopeptide (TPR) repeat protein